MVLLLSGALLCPLAGTRADEPHAHSGIRISPGILAIGVATLVTGARIAVVLAAGGTVLGGRIGTGLLAIYLAHVVAEGAMYGVGAGALALGQGTGEKDTEHRPTIKPDRLAEHVPSQRLPLQLDSRYSRYR
jgi:hypothetical protein